MMNYKTRIYGTTKELSVDTMKAAFSDKKVDFIKIALLFGSRALGRQHNKSDYDFALLMSEDTDAPWGVKSKAYIVLEELLQLDDCDIDIVDLNNMDNVVKDSIKEGFIILKGDEDEISRLLG